MSDGAITQNSSLPALCTVLVVPATARHRENSPTSCISWAHLMSVYLTGMHPMGIYLIGMHLTGMYLIGVYLIGVHFMGAHLMGVHLTGVHLTGVHFMSVHLTPERCIGMHFIGVYLTGKKLHAATPESVLGREVQAPATPEQESPVSTAPARLAEAQRAEDRGKRKRRVTEAYPLPQ
jgi:uncharacterized protein YjbI with pentapeptide repeats